MDIVIAIMHHASGYLEIKNTNVRTEYLEEDVKDYINANYKVDDDITYMVVTDMDINLYQL